jgi:GT2 family glycosyltransferase
VNTSRLYVITAVHNRYSITEKYVHNLKQQTFQGFQLILVDDGSTDGTDRMVKEVMPDAVILYGNGNLWWAGSLHKAYNYIKDTSTNPDDCVLITNNDISFQDDFLEAGVNLLQHNPHTFIPALGYSSNDGSLRDGAIHWDFKTGNNWVLSPNDSGNCASTRALFFCVADFLKVGGFHPTLLPHYGSDYEFCIRAWRKGCKIKSFAELTYVFNEKTTGDRDYVKCNTKELLRLMFRRRSSFNPFYKLNLLVLVTPFPHLLGVLYAQTRTVTRKLNR